MSKIWRAVKVVVVIFMVVWFISLLFGNSSKSRKLDKQNKIIHMYETTYINGESEFSSQISELESQLEAANSRIAELEQQVNGGVQDNVYFNLRFPADGNYYKEAYDEVQFYSDPTCTVKISDVRFMSAEVDLRQAENGLEIYCLRMDNGQICYCTEGPYLITEKKYNEMHEGK